MRAEVLLTLLPHFFWLRCFWNSQELWSEADRGPRVKCSISLSMTINSHSKQP